MNFEPSLVIHDGQLMSISQAWRLMMEEFPPHGYNVATIETILQRAHSATQAFLRQLTSFSESLQQEYLNTALNQDARIAEQWRAYWKAHPNQDWSGYQAEKEKQHEEDKKEWAYAAWKDQQRREFDRWVRLNETGGRDAGAEDRAANRKRIDDEAARRVIARIEQWQHRHRRRSGYQGIQALLDKISDHEYIEWMFACAEHGWNPIV